MCETCSPHRDNGYIPAKKVFVTASAELAETPKGRLAVATHNKLVELGRFDTPEGVAAVLAAEQLDSGRLTGQQYASLLKAWLATIDAATKSESGVSSALDELRKRREQRRTGT